MGCTQFTLSMLAQQQQLSIGRVAWESSGTVDLRTLMGDLPKDQAGCELGAGVSMHSAALRALGRHACAHGHAPESIASSAQ